MSLLQPNEPPRGRPKRMSTTVKLVLMGVGAMALLYSCSPMIGGIPGFWFFGNPFYRGGFFSSPSSVTTSTPSGTTGQTAGEATSQRGGFGSSAASPGGSSS